MHTDVQRDVTTQDRRTKTKGKEQNNRIHYSRNDLMRIDESERLLVEIDLRGIQMRMRPIDTWKQIQEPWRILWDTSVR
jgi:hypothetical protein